jgi:hypothetical protein
MSSLWLSCPHCQVLFNVEDAQAGQQVACRACGKSVRIPGTPPASPPWYYTRARQPVGPVTFDELKELARSGQLLPSDRVWREGMDQWAAARSVEGLFPAPPPLPTEEPLPKREEVTDSNETVPIEVEEVPAEVTAEPEPIRPPVTSPTTTAEDAWDVATNRPATSEEAIHVEPEFQIELESSQAPIAEPEEMPTVDLILPSQSGSEPLTIEPDIELAPVEPRLELGESDEEKWTGPYDLAPQERPRAEEIVAVPESSVEEPGPYSLEETPAAGPPLAIPVTEAIAAAPMAIPVPPVEARPHEETEEERIARLRREFRQEREAWRKVRRGVGIVYLALAVWLAVFAGYLLIGGAVAIFGGESMGRSQEAGVGSVLLAVCLVLLALAVDTACIVGFCYCLAVPVSVGSRPLVIVVLVLTGCAELGAFIAAFVPPLQLVIFALGFDRWVLFLFFLQTIAQAFESHYLVRDIERVLLFLGGGAGVCIILWVLMAYLSATLTRGSESGDAASTITLTCGRLCTVFPMLGLVGYGIVRYLQVLRDTVAIIDEKLYRG